MKNISILTAILLAIKEFGTKEFSIWEITKKIRENLWDDVYTLKYHFKTANHDTIKELFEEFLSVGLLDEYSSKMDNSGTYRIFWKEDKSAPVVSPVAPVSPIKQQVAPSLADNFPTSVQVKMANYITANGPVTMKQIQSRLKDYSYTCEEIKDFLFAVGYVNTTTLGRPNSKVLSI